MTAMFSYYLFVDLWGNIPYKLDKDGLIAKRHYGLEEYLEKVTEMSFKLMTLIENPVTVSFFGFESPDEGTHYRGTYAQLKIRGERPLTYADFTGITSLFEKNGWSGRLSEEKDKMRYIPINFQFPQKSCNSCRKSSSERMPLLGNYCSEKCLSKCKIPGITC